MYCLPYQVFERVLEAQLSDFMTSHFNPGLSAFRKGFSCNSVLINLIEDWKKALDNNEVIGAILIDLSKAFDSMDHKLLIEKRKAYNVSEQATDLLRDYLSHRKQRVKQLSTTLTSQMGCFLERQRLSASTFRDGSLMMLLSAALPSLMLRFPGTKATPLG